MKPSEWKELFELMEAVVKKEKSAGEKCEMVRQQAEKCGYTDVLEEFMSIVSM